MAAVGGKATGERQAIIYVRVSTSAQAEAGVSLAAQEARGRAWAEAAGYCVAGVYVDAGLSGGRADNRPGLVAALDHVDRVRGALVVYSLSRMSRSVRDTISIGDRLRKAGADLVSLSESLDTTSAAGRMVYTVLAAMAQFERDLASERTAAALRFKRNRGERTGGDVPFGFRSEDGMLVPVEAEQAVIGRARELRGRGLSLRAVARELEAGGLRSRAGRPFHATQVRRMLEAA